MPASKMGSDARAHLESLGLNDPARYVTISNYPILDVHPPLKKMVRNRAAISKDNPNGLVEQDLKVDAKDLATLAANSNRMVAVGRLPMLQIGHTPLEGRPEPFQPKPVGLTSNYCVAERDGKPWLCCDIHIRKGDLGEAQSYPNISVERVNWDKPDQHVIHAVSLLRRAPERPVPLVPYGRDEPVANQFVCYGRDVIAPTTSGQDKARQDSQTRMDLIGYYQISLDEAQEHLDLMNRYNISKTEAHRRIEARKKAETRVKPPTSEEFIKYATERGISNPAEARRRFMADRAKDLV